MQDNIMPTGRWEFDSDVTKCFDDMLERSIPNYETMRDLSFRVGHNFVNIGKSIVDIGCSRGTAIEPYIKTYGPDLKYYLFDVSEPMLDVCRKKYGSNGREIHIENHNINDPFGISDACIVMSILTIQFSPIEHRQNIVKNIYDSLEKGGAFIFVEKVLGYDSDIDKVFVSEYYNIKSEHKYTQEQIESKRKSLSGILVPITAKWNEDLLKSVGFTQVDCFWRYLNFAGWVAIK